MVTGTIIKIQSQKENDWGRYTIDTISGKTMLAVGIIQNAAVGMEATLEGYVETNKYGTQFKITSVLATKEDKFSGVITFLSDGYMKGIGKTVARNMVMTFGKNVLDLFETPEGRRRLETVKGLGAKSVAKAYESYKKNKEYKDIVLFLNGIGTKYQVEKIYAKYGKKALKVLQTNPYCLEMDLNGFGFKKTDAIALAAGIKKDSIFRIMAGIKDVIETAQTQNGHCYLPMEDVEKSVLPLLAPVPKLKDISEKVAENALENFCSNREKLITEYDPSAETLEILGQVAETRELISASLRDAITKATEDGYLINENGNIYTSVMHYTENKVAEMISAMGDRDSLPVRSIKPETIEKTIKEVEERKTGELKRKGIPGAFEITQEQRDAVYIGLKNRICIISGGPGRGKTAISEIIARAFIHSGGYESDILMLAPTGKAARRITESTGYTAMTIHRAAMAVKKGQPTPQKKLIICDESSMIDIFLMLDLLKFAKDCNLVLVGDVDQIASVGPGKVLRDLINSGCIPCILLKQGHRNSGAIAKNAALINSGIPTENYQLDPSFIFYPFVDDYKHTEDGQIAKDSHGEYIVQKKATDKMFDSVIENYIKNVAKYGIQNVMLCAAMKERGTCCVERLNRQLQEIYTSKNAYAKIGNRILRVGDRVMQTKNDYNFLKKDMNGDLIFGVFNGETGIISHILYDNVEETYKIVVKFDDGSIGGYTSSTAQMLQLAYAITIHKCQGSEAKCVMVVHSYSDYMLLERSLFYTGVTRAKEVCQLFGEIKYRYGKYLSAFDVAVKTTNNVKRNTMLCTRVQALMVGGIETCETR